MKKGLVFFVLMLIFLMPFASAGFLADFYEKFSSHNQITGMFSFRELSKTIDGIRTTTTTPKSPTKTVTQQPTSNTNPSPTPTATQQPSSNTNPSPTQTDTTTDSRQDTDSSNKDQIEETNVKRFKAKPGRYLISNEGAKKELVINLVMDRNGKKFARSKIVYSNINNKIIDIKGAKYKVTVQGDKVKLVEVSESSTSGGIDRAAAGVALGNNNLAGSTQSTSGSSAVTSSSSLGSSAVTSSSSSGSSSSLSFTRAITRSLGGLFR
ncbi:hypothetical protein D6777_01870 [Candidatus Woesearchaeota archaeon]|nr:MAG: hypothetical protein D6777_01870 [Candidatus Woesearchaeota archaeon]